MKRRRTVTGPRNPAEFFKHSDVGEKVRASSLGHAASISGAKKTTLGNESGLKRSSNHPTDHVLSKNMSPTFLNTRDDVSLKNSAYLISRPSASTPDLHSYGLPVCDTLKKTFRHGFSPGSDINSGGSDPSRLMSSEKTRSRSIVEESLPDANEGSYLEEFSKHCEFIKEKKNDNTVVATANLENGNISGKSLLKSQTNEDMLLNTPVLDSNEKAAKCHESSCEKIVNSSVGINATQDKTQTPEHPLSGVVAFLDVRSTNENRFEGVAQQLEKLGANVVRKFTSEVTHVVFKNGRKSTLNLIEKHDVHFVSVLWVDSCKRTWSRVDEGSFPASKSDTGSPLGNIRGKMKRLKSLQPKAFDEDLNNSGKLEGRRKRRNVTKDKNLELNLDLALWENAEKMDLSKIIQEPDSIANSPLGNESPFLKQVKKRWAEKRASLGGSPISNMFDLVEEEATESCDDSLKERIESILNTSKNGLNSCKPEEDGLSREDGLNRGKDVAECNTEDQRLLAARDSKRDMHCQDLSAQFRSQTDPKQDKAVEFSSTIEGSGEDVRHRGVEDAKRQNCCKRKSFMANELSKVVEGNKDMKDTGDNPVVSVNDDNDKPSQCNQPVRKKRKLLAKDHSMAAINFSIHPKKTEATMPVACRTSEDQNKKPEELQNTDNSETNSLQSARESHPSKRKRESPTISRKKLKQLAEAKNETAKIDENVPTSSALEKGGTDCSKVTTDVGENQDDADALNSESDEKTDNECSRAKKTSKFIKKDKPKSNRVKKSLVMTSLHFSEQKFVRTAVTRLGLFNLSENVNSTTTHLIAGSNRRTLNILNATIQGAWILSPDWVCASYDQEKWLAEDEYELIKDFPSAKANRCKKNETGECPVSQMLSSQPPIYVAENTTPPREVLLKLIRKCGGQSTSCVRKAEICIGRCLQQDNDIKEVEERWLLDCIMESQILRVDDYLISKVEEKG